MFDWQNYLKVGAPTLIVGGIGGLVAGYFRDVVFQRSLESWKSRKALQAAYRRFRDPIVLSAVELCDRLHELSELHHGDFINERYLSLTVSKSCTNSDDDPYFLRYKVVSSLYRFCAFLGWLELYRQEITFLDSGHGRLNKKFEACITKIRSAMADGFLLSAPDWLEWDDALIFREEQRAIGEVMIVTADEVSRVIGYSGFSQLLDERGKAANWFHVALNFMSGLDGPKSFKRVRVKYLVCHLLDLIEILDEKRLTDRRKGFRSPAVAAIKAFEKGTSAAAAAASAG